MTDRFAILPLGEVVDIVGGGTPSKRNPKFYGGSIPWATVRDMNVDELAKTEHSITEAGLTASSSNVIPAGNIVIATRVGLGKVCRLMQDTAINQDLRGLLPKEDRPLDRKYLFYWYKSISDKVVAAGTGATVQGVKLPFVKSLAIPLPALEEQRRIVAILDGAFEGLDRARAHAEANLRDGKELFDEAVSACFRNVPKHSTHCTLGQLAQFRNGLNFTRTSQGDEVKVVGVGDFRDNFEVPVSEISNARIDGNLDEDDRLKPGDLLVVRSNGNRQLIGRTMLVPKMSESISFSGFTIRIRLNSKGIFPEYLCSFMRTKEARKSLTSGGGGTNISNLNQRLLSSFPIVFPHTDAQLEILDRVQVIQSTKTDVIQRYENSLADFDDLRQSLLQRTFAGELT